MTVDSREVGSAAIRREGSAGINIRIQFQIYLEYNWDQHQNRIRNIIKIYLEYN